MKIYNLTDYYIQKFIIVYGDKYDYHKTNIKSSSDKITVTCKIHGDFTVTPNNHLSKGSGCPLCKNIDKNFIEKCNLIHNSFYDYSLVDYKNNRTKIKIICPKHGIFEQLPMNHKKGIPCPRCSADNRKYNIDDLIILGNKIHSNKYDYKYLKTDYIRSDKKVRIICPEHGIFLQDPFSHFSRGHGCKLCKKMSSGESKIEDFLIDNKISYIRQKTFDGCINLTKLSFDFFVPIYNLCIEFNGRQHYQPISVFGGNIQYLKQIENDRIKFEYCMSNDINLLIIKYDENIIDKLSKYLKSITENIHYHTQSFRYLRHTQRFNYRVNRR